ncbi:MAG TPA: sigma 54-interacting transcriptional regulator [Candidatus Latescibacteria bacterium]|nr:sigma 54-interacting transcriptional regulator [Candidatus Latescibacterota bacterium]HJP31946.1 sigma 54-interacting transcriptional regulator [Candidatus Latescibacterota bacterium]
MTLAREYAYDSWPRLAEAVESSVPASSGAEAVGPLVGDALQQVRTQLVRAAATGVAVLLVGERGTGKRLAAHTLHSAGSRRSTSMSGSWRRRTGI